ESRPGLQIGICEALRPPLSSRTSIHPSIVRLQSYPHTPLRRWAVPVRMGKPRSNFQSSTRSHRSKILGDHIETVSAHFAAVDCCSSSSFLPYHRREKHLPIALYSA